MDFKKSILSNEDDRSDDYQKVSSSGKISLFQVQNDEQSSTDQEGTNGVAGTALAIISTIMGGGIVSIPYAYAVEGIIVGITV